MKTCTKCGITKHLEQFYNNKRAKDGKTCVCKDCDYQYTKDWRKNNSEEKKKRARREYWRNIERSREKGRENYKRNKEKRLAYCSKYAKENRAAKRNVGRRRYDRKKRARFPTPDRDWETIG